MLARRAYGKRQELVGASERDDGKPSSYNRATQGLLFYARAVCMSHWMWIGKIGEAWALEYYRRSPIAINTLFLRGNQDRFDLDDTVCLGLDITSSGSVQTEEEVGNKLARGPLDVLVDDPDICYTMTAIDTESKMVAAVFAVNVFSPP